MLSGARSSMASGVGTGGEASPCSMLAGTALEAVAAAASCRSWRRLRRASAVAAAWCTALLLLMVLTLQLRSDKTASSSDAALVIIEPSGSLGVRSPNARRARDAESAAGSIRNAYARKQHLTGALFGAAGGTVAAQSLSSAAAAAAAHSLATASASNASTAVAAAAIQESTYKELQHDVAWSLLVSFSPRLENHAQRMFLDKFAECRFHALGPALALWRGAVVACVRLFLPQYILALEGSAPQPIDTWQENYVYSMSLRPSDYAQLDTGRLLGIPTPTNSDREYRKDGPMDPRAFVLKDRLYLVFYSYGRPAEDSRARCRMYLWDYEASEKRLLAVVNGLKIQKPADINWAPLVVGGDTLYFVYSFDPLRILRCDADIGRCRLHYAQPSAAEHPFNRTADVLRGGTPFVEYAHPYYVSVAHAAVQTDSDSGLTSYRTHLVVVRVGSGGDASRAASEPWRVVYVSEPVRAHATWLSSVPLVSSSYVADAFWYPTALIIRDRDTFDIGCHLNDHSSYVVRLAGMARLMHDVMRQDAAHGGAPLPVRAVQTYVRSAYLRSAAEMQTEGTSDYDEERYKAF